MKLKQWRVFILCVLAMTFMNIESLQAATIGPHLYKTKLNNGLTLLVKETPGTKVATVQIWVKAGSIYEAGDEAGITHLIEHMIFKGTPTRGPGQLADVIESVGGQVNAYTSYEYTVYHALLSASHWSLALEVLTDAVLHSLFDAGELEREKKVVLEEVKMRQDQPGIMLYQGLMDHAYTAHPYRLPIIGNVGSVAAINREKILSYINKHYYPGNLTVVVVGDVSYGQVSEKVEMLLGGLPAVEQEKISIPAEPRQNSSRFFHVEKDVNQVHMAIALPISRFNSPDTPVLDVVAHILGEGESSRLYHQLRDKEGLVYKIEASAFTPADPGLLEITAVLDAKNTGPALEKILTEVFKTKFVNVSEEELERAKRNIEGDFVFNLERAEGQARVLGSFEFLNGDPREEEYLNKLRSVTATDVQRVAAHYFSPDRITVGFVTPGGTKVGIEAATLPTIIYKAETAAREGVPTSLQDNAFLSGLHRFKLRNGVILLVRETTDVPTVSVRALFLGGLMAENAANNGAFNFIGELLTKGTETLSARELTLAVANIAGDISGFSGKNTFGVKASFLSRFFDDGLVLVRDVVRTPAFALQEMEKLRPELLASLRQQEDSLPAVAFREINRLLFEGHPYALNSFGSEAAIKNLTVEDLKKLYHSYARPDHLVLVVSGKVEAIKVKEAVERLFGDWTIQQPKGKDAVVQETHLRPEPPVAPRIHSVARDKEQVHIVIGFLGTTINSSDRYAMEMLDTILSGQSGRLFQELRDKQSLAYSLSSFSQLGLDTGSFGIYIGTSPEKKDAAITGVWKELYRIREQPVTPAELEKAKNVLIGNYELGLQTHGAQALEIALNEVYNLGQDFGNTYVRQIRELRPEDLLAAAKKYILPEHYVMVTVGAP